MYSYQNVKSKHERYEHKCKKCGKCDKECLLVCSIISVLNILYVGGTIYLMQETGDISLSV
jgi:hypothetical protein